MAHTTLDTLTALFGKPKKLPNQRTSDVLPRRHEPRDRPPVQQTLDSIRNERK